MKQVSSCWKNNVYQTFWSCTRSQPGSLTHGQSQPHSLYLVGVVGAGELGGGMCTEFPQGHWPQFLWPHGDQH